MKAVRAYFGDVVELQTGFTSRADSGLDSEAGTRVLSAADLRGGVFEMGPPRRVGEGVSSDRYGVEAGEVFFKSRGSAFEAARLSDINEPMVFAAPLVRLRLDPSKLDADYLVWFLNSGPMQRQLEAAARGTAVQSVGPVELRQLLIPLPSIEAQMTIAEIEAMRRREASLMARLEAARKVAFDAQVFGKLNSFPPNPPQQELA